MIPVQTKPTRLWFLNQGYKQADLQYTNGCYLWLHPKTNDVLNQYGQKLKLSVVPYEKYLKSHTRYLKMPRAYGNMYLARLKYLTFKGEIKPGDVIDHIDGDTMNNDIRNLRAVPRAINDRDGGFMRKLRNNKIYVDKFPGIILEGYERLAQWKATHTQSQYKRLKDEALLKVFVGPTHNVVNPSIIMDLDFTEPRER